MKLLKLANESFRCGDFLDALDKYAEFSEKHDEKLVKINIELCKKNILKSSKDISNKNINNVNGYFDNVYVVNLKHKILDRLKIAKHLSDNKIKFEIFNAVNGYEGKALEAFDEYKKKEIGSLKRYQKYSFIEKNRGSHLIESAGAMGYIHTYIRILEDAKTKNYKRILILEDDVILENDFDGKFNAFIKSIDQDWKVLLLGASQYGWDNVDLNRAKELGYYYPGRTSDSKSSTCGSFAIAFDHTIFDEVIEAQKSFEAPFDHLPMTEIYERYAKKCFVTFPNIVMPDVTESTIRHGRDQYKHGEIMKWKVQNFDFPLAKPSISIIIQDKVNLKYLKTFSRFSNQEFDLRLYFNSRDGLRPIHNCELLKSEINLNTLPIESSELVLESDYAATISKYDVISENEVVKFLEYKIGLVNKNESCLVEIDFKRKTIVRDRVSVIIPTYKRPKNLKNALRSVSEQEYSDIEVIVVSDNGADSDFNIETRDIVSELNLNNSTNVHFKLIEHKVNRNGAAARNTGFIASSGEYICFLDDDDMYLPDRILSSAEKLKKSSYKVGAVYCGFLGWNSPNNDLNRYKEGDLKKELLLLDYKKHYLHTNTATYKRDAVLSLNGFDESYKRHQDFEFNLRFFESYLVEAVKISGVRLNPEQSDVNNKLYNSSMMDLKMKFLGEFDFMIKETGIKDIIYNTHWGEVGRYISDLDGFNSYLSEQIENGPLQVNFMLKGDKND